MIKGENVRIMVGGQVVGMAKEAKFSIAEDDVSTKEFPEPWRTPDIKQSWDITGNVMVRDAGDVMRDLLNGKEKKNVTIQRKPPRLPRKMKKAYRSDYPRNTKWTRKVVNMIRRQSQTFHDCEVVVTPDQIRLVEGYHRRLAYSDGHKPLALSDVKDAFLCGAEEMERLIDSSM